VATEVTLPQLGESVTEGTITAWLVEVGDRVEADQPLFELSSDKIDTEVPAPTSGVLKEIKVEVDETVDVGTVVAIIGEDGEEPGEAAAEEPAEAEARTETEAAETAEEAAGEPEAGTGATAGDVEDRETVAAEGTDAERTAAPPPAEAERPARGDGGNGEGVLTSPIVRRLAAENDLDLSTVEGTGQGGRVTREDIEKVISSRAGKAAPAGPAAPAARREQPERRPAAAEGARERVEDLSRIRQRIADKMMESLQSSAQLTTVQEADVTPIMRLRARHKDQFAAREGVSLSPFAFLCRAAVIAVRRHERINAQADWETGKVRFFDYVNLGIAVDTEKGLLVPNVKNADDLTLPALARAIAEAADKARGIRKLEMQDIEGGTFTVTNTGSVGVLIDTPILNYPEVAILGTGAIKKRPVVAEGPEGESLAIRHMMYLSFTYDHRLIDGADAARYVTDVKQVIETHDWATELGY
jgi:pyruvate dehydrogenase E2 component (dihydrolipoamide acetyltransferase)